MHIAVTRQAPGAELERVDISCNGDAEALTEVWRLLLHSSDLVELEWRRSDGSEFDLRYLQAWASER